jgi:hypothetical protein
LPLDSARGDLVFPRTRQFLEANSRAPLNCRAAQDVPRTLGVLPASGEHSLPWGPVEDGNVELLRPLLRQWLGETMLLMDEKALRVEMTQSPQDPAASVGIDVHTPTAAFR